MPHVVLAYHGIVLNKRSDHDGSGVGVVNTSFVLMTTLMSLRLSGRESGQRGWRERDEDDVLDGDSLD